MIKGMQLTSERQKAVVEYASSKKALLDSKALQLLGERSDFKEIIDELLGNNQFVLSAEIVESKIAKPKVEASAIEIKRSGFKAFAKDIDADFKIMEEYDVTGKSCSEGTVKDFLRYFQSKFELLSEMLRKRHTISPKPIKRLRAVSKNSAVDLIAMVFRKWVTKNGHIAFQVEDLESSCIVLVLKDDVRLTAEAEHVLLDNVIAIKGIKWAEGLVIAKEILFPELPLREQRKADRNVSIASISDVHMGSKLFLEKPLNSFIEWINGRVDSRKEKGKVGRIKYLIVSGDNVDGIGIYPQQFKELNIKDIRQQYTEFGKYIAAIPGYIEIFICPGQHDAVRWADPQPAIPEELVEEIAGLSNVHFVGSPSWVKIEGLKTMIYHGSSLHDLISSVSFLNAEHPEQAMIELLRKRNLMSAYGLKQPYVPEKKDYMAVCEEPDLVYIGDMHHNAYGNYRGCTVINSGTWQDRTSYQIKLGHVPTPGIVPVLNLSNRRINENHFYKGVSNEA